MSQIERQREAWLVISAVIELINMQLPKAGPKTKADLETTKKMLTKLADVIETSLAA